ncbi:MAG TPA: hypothetical protein VGI50_16925 [Solirubrobacteraceae bacterium]
MDPDPHTEELRLTQADRERAERRLADESPEEQETAQHERRADKARYLREKLEQRAESEREAEPAGSDAGQDAGRGEGSDGGAG